MSFEMFLVLWCTIGFLTGCVCLWSEEDDIKVGDLVPALVGGTLLGFLFMALILCVALSQYSDVVVFKGRKKRRMQKRKKSDE